MGIFDNIANLFGGNKEKLIEEGQEVLSGKKSLQDVEGEFCADGDEDNALVKAGKGMLRDKFGLPNKPAKDEEPTEESDEQYTDTDEDPE